MHSDHMYGAAVLARNLAEHHGGPDVVREIWAYGGPLSGEDIYFPDAVAAVVSPHAEDRNGRAEHRARGLRLRC